MSKSILQQWQKIDHIEDTDWLIEWVREQPLTPELFDEQSTPWLVKIRRLSRGKTQPVLPCCGNIFTF